MIDNPKYIEACSLMSEILYRNGGKACYLTKMTQDYIDRLDFPELIRDNHGGRLLPGTLYVIVTCPNDYRYYVNVSGDSVLTMCAEVLNFIQGK